MMAHFQTSLGAVRTQVSAFEGDMKEQLEALGATFNQSLSAHMEETSQTRAALHQSRAEETAALQTGMDGLKESMNAVMNSWFEQHLAREQQVRTRVDQQCDRLVSSSQAVRAAAASSLDAARADVDDFHKTVSTTCTAAAAETHRQGGAGNQVGVALEADSERTQRLTREHLEERERAAEALTTTLRQCQESNASALATMGTEQQQAREADVSTMSQSLEASRHAMDKLSVDLSVASLAAVDRKSVV